MTVGLYDAFGKRHEVRFYSGRNVIVGRNGDIRFNIGDSKFYNTLDELTKKVKGYEKVSRKHFLLSVRDEKIVLKDTSVNGTWVNGVKIGSQEIVLENGDEILAGPNYRIIFESDGKIEYVPVEIKPAILDRLKKFGKEILEKIVDSKNCLI